MHGDGYVAFDRASKKIYISRRIIRESRSWLSNDDIIEPVLIGVATTVNGPSKPAAGAVWDDDVRYAAEIEPTSELTVVGCAVAVIVDSIIADLGETGTLSRVGVIAVA